MPLCLIFYSFMTQGRRQFPVLPFGCILPALRLSAAVVSIMKAFPSRESPSLGNACPSSFISICTCSTLLPGAGAGCAHRQQAKTGLGLKAVMGFSPLRGSLRAALIAWSRSCGAVTGRKYHYRLSMSWQAARHRPLWDGHLPLCTFDVIFLAGCPAGGHGVSSAPLCSFKLDS